eukprot:COSAG03_NODE_13235_length_510_cov_13.440389_2_plen_53_part_01
MRASTVQLLSQAELRVETRERSVPNLTQELNSKNGFIEAHGLTEEPTERPKSS